MPGRLLPIEAAFLLALAGAHGAVTSLTAQGGPVARGPEISLGAGTGSLGTSCDACGGIARQSGVVVHFWVGGPVGPRLLIGGDIVRWSGRQRDTATAIAFLTATAHYYPLRMSDWFVNGGIGVSSYARFLALPSNGLGLSFGTGIDIKVARTLLLTPAAQVLWGSSRDVRDNEQLLRARGLKPNLIAIDVNASIHFRSR
jgi:hypothetical protein